MPTHPRWLDKARLARLKAALSRLLDRFRKFVYQEWSSVLIWAAIGILSAAIAHLLASDVLFEKYCLDRYMALRAHFGGAHLYSIFLIGSAIAIILAILPAALMLLWKGVKSWALGVTSGLCLISFLSSFLFFLYPDSGIERAMLLDACVIGIACCISFGLYLAFLARIQKIPLENRIRVSDSYLQLAGSSIPNTDDPIESWTEDLLGRAPIVNSVSFSLLISKTPVLALLGPFGTGKTSILNLLARHLRDKAIVVSFSTWLPGSADTISSYLLEDISRECRRLYVAPRMRKSARKLAASLAKRVPLLDSMSAILSESTQREEIQMLTRALARLPRRVIVLLDEVDRMGKPELEALLKVLRGLSLSSNLSFVCAFDREIVESTVRETFDPSSNVYFEKFFPISISIPIIDGDALKRIAVSRVGSALLRRGWFETEIDREAFETSIGDHWLEMLAPFLTTVRAIGLLANDVSATSHLRGEIDLIDLTLIELLRRFEPKVYEIIWRYRQTLSEGERSLQRYRFQMDQEKEAEEKHLGTEVDEALKSNARATAIKVILGRLFPKYGKIGKVRLSSLLGKQAKADSTNRISDPAVMRTYFHQKLGEDVFSSREMHHFVRELKAAGTNNDVRQRIAQKITSMDKGDPKREDFLDKLSEQVKTLDLALATEIVLACMGVAGKLAYDMFFSVGEAGDVLRMVVRVAERKEEHSDRVAFLGECIRVAGDDTMSHRILRSCSKPGQDFDLGVSFAEMYAYFIQRLVGKYGPGADHRNPDLRLTDWETFNLWGFSDFTREGFEVDPKQVAENRANQRTFWLDYIGTSEKRLADAFFRFILPVMEYQGDPRQFIENKIPISDLKQLYESAVNDGPLTVDQEAALAMLKRILDGEFTTGIEISEWQKERQRIGTSNEATDREETELVLGD